jgi:hypothetical protein
MVADTPDPNLLQGITSASEKASSKEKKGPPKTADLVNTKRNSRYFRIMKKVSTYSLTLSHKRE